MKWGDKFFIKREGARLATLFYCFNHHRLTDVFFAIDSIPAILAITADPFYRFQFKYFGCHGIAFHVLPYIRNAQQIQIH